MGSLIVCARTDPCAYAPNVCAHDRASTCAHGPAGRRGAVRALLLLAVGVSMVLAALGAQGAHAAVEGMAELTDPEIALSAYADPPVVTLGDAVTFTVLVENTGDVTLHGLVVTDGDDIEHEHDDAFLPDDLVEWTVRREIDAGDVRVGTVVATFAAEATDEAGTLVRAAKVVTVEVLGHPQQRGAAWAGAPGEGGEAGMSRRAAAAASIAIVVLLTALAALIGGWVTGRIGTVWD